MDFTNPDILYFGSTLIATAMAALTAKYYGAKKLITSLNGTLAFAQELVTELSEFIDEVNKALKDDSLSKEELAAIMAQLNDVVEKLKKAIKLVTKEEPQE